MPQHDRMPFIAALTQQCNEKGASIVIPTKDEVLPQNHPYFKPAPMWWQE